MNYLHSGLNWPIVIEFVIEDVNILELENKLVNTRSLRTICGKDRLRVYKIEKKNDFLKICQNKGLGKLVLKIYLSDRLEVY